MYNLPTGHQQRLYVAGILVSNVDAGRIVADINIAYQEPL